MLVQYCGLKPMRSFQAKAGMPLQNLRVGLHQLVLDRCRPF
jgi:hypothetical protein